MNIKEKTSELKIKGLSLAALSMGKAIEDNPFGPEILVFRIFDTRGPLFAIISEKKEILNVRVSPEFFLAADTFIGIEKMKVWKHWVSVDFTLVSDEKILTDYVKESWYEVRENLPIKKRNRLQI